MLLEVKHQINWSVLADKRGQRAGSAGESGAVSHERASGHHSRQLSGGVGECAVSGRNHVSRHQATCLHIRCVISTCIIFTVCSQTMGIHDTCLQVVGRTVNLNTYKYAAGSINLTNEAKIPVITSTAPHFGLTLRQLGETRPPCNPQRI